MIRAVRRAAVVWLVGLSAVGRAEAHAIHTTLTVAQLDGQVLTLTIRSFADDFAASVARHAGRATPRDSSAPPDDVARYLRDRITLTDASGRRLALTSCGIRRVGDLYFTCVRATLGPGVRGVRLQHAMLTELHADQVNIVQFERRGTRRTLLFTRASAPTPLEGQA